MRLLKSNVCKTLFFFTLMIVVTFGCCAMIEIFTDSLHPVYTETMHSDSKTNTISYYNLDQLSQLVNQMNVTLAGHNSQEAFTQSKYFLDVYQKAISHAVEGNRLANHYSITAVPDIIFDRGVFQIQGQTDLQIAMDEYQNFVSEKK